MGFANGSYATVWGQPRSLSPKATSLRVSISVKDKATGNYVQKFGDFVTFAGSACAEKALRLKERDRIQLVRVNTDNVFDKQNGTTRYFFSVFDFKSPLELSQAEGSSGNTYQHDYSDPMPGNVDDGELDVADDKLPF